MEELRAVLHSVSHWWCCSIVHASSPPSTYYYYHYYSKVLAGCRCFCKTVCCLLVAGVETQLLALPCPAILGGYSKHPCPLSPCPKLSPSPTSHTPPNDPRWQMKHRRPLPRATVLRMDLSRASRVQRPIAHPTTRIRHIHHFAGKQAAPAPAPAPASRPSRTSALTQCAR
jgi:hypothetical protein